MCSPLALKYLVNVQHLAVFVSPGRTCEICEGLTTANAVNPPKLIHPCQVTGFPPATVFWFLKAVCRFRKAVCRIKSHDLLPLLADVDNGEIEQLGNRATRIVAASAQDLDEMSRLSGSSRRGVLKILRGAGGQTFGQNLPTAGSETLLLPRRLPSRPLPALSRPAYPCRETRRIVREPLCLRVAWGRCGPGWPGGTLSGWRSLVHRASLGGSLERSVATSIDGEDDLP